MTCCIVSSHASRASQYLCKIHFRIPTANESHSRTAKPASPSANQSPMRRVGRTASYAYNERKSTAVPLRLLLQAGILAARYVVHVDNPWRLRCSYQLISQRKAKKKKRKKKRKARNNIEKRQESSPPSSNRHHLPQKKALHRCRCLTPFHALSRSPCCPAANEVPHFRNTGFQPVSSISALTRLPSLTLMSTNMIILEDLL